MRKLFLIILTVNLIAGCAKQPESKAVTLQSQEPPTVPATIITPISPPTPTPEVRIQSGDLAILEADSARAREEYLAAAKDSDDVNLQAAALLGMGRSYLLEKNYTKAEEYLKAILDEHPVNDFIPQAHWFLYKLYKEQGKTDIAIASLEKFLSVAPDELLAFTEQTLADEYLAGNSYDKAINAFQGALNSNPGDPDYFHLQLGKAYQSIGEEKASIDSFLKALETTSNPYIGSQADLLMGQAYENLGFPEQAYVRYQDSVTKYPEAYDSFTALTRLLNAGQNVDQYQAGLVNYYAKKYGAAADAFSKYLFNTNNPNLDAYYFRAQSYLGADEPEKAIGDLKNLINTAPESAHWSDAWFESAYIHWAYLDNFTTGAQTLLDFVSKYPQHQDAPKALFNAGRIYDRGQYPTLAADTWARVINEYPMDPSAPRAFLLSGVMHFRSREMAEARSSFERNVALSVDGQDKAAALLWLGKTQAEMGQSADAKKSWQEAALISPTEYYSIRANELANDEPILTPDSNYALGVDFKLERREAARWLASNFDLTSGADLEAITPLMSDPIFRKAKGFWDIGEYQTARGYFETYRNSIKEDIEKTFLLANYSLDLGNFRTAIFASKSILDAAAAKGLTQSLIPKYFDHIRFGPYYRETVLENAKVFNFSPLLLFSLIRQESFFEGFVSSSVGANGLMQLMPATAQDVVDRFGWPTNFELTDLVKPSINVRLGTQYLAIQRDYFPNMYVALAAYNAGPGNAGIWNSVSKGDPDLFFETIRYDETRQYIMYITENLAMYNKLYQIP